MGTHSKRRSLSTDKVKQARKVSIRMTGIAHRAEVSEFVKFLKSVPWLEVTPVHRHEHREFCFEVKVSPENVPLLRTLVDFQSSKLGPNSVIETLRFADRVGDLRRLSHEEQGRADEVERAARAAEPAEANFQVST